MLDSPICKQCQIANDTVDWLPDPYYDRVFRQIKGAYLCPDCFWDLQCEAEDECQD